MDVERFIFIMKKVMGDDIMLGRKNSYFSVDSTLRRYTYSASDNKMTVWR